LVQSRYFDGLSVNRVQDNFVVQWGDADGKRSLGAAAQSVAPEFQRAWSDELPFVKLPDADGFASEVGFVEGLPVAGNRAEGKIWPAHCYASLGVGRDNAADSGNGAELYVVIGHAPRQLDRNITIAGRVVHGMPLLSSLPRGTGALGFYTEASQRIPIRSMRVAADVPRAERSAVRALRTDSPTFTRLIEARRNRRDDWYLAPAGHIDLCNVPLPIRLTP
jgi:peptidylprolyl isomerase